MTSALLVRQVVESVRRAFSLEVVGGAGAESASVNLGSYFRATASTYFDSYTYGFLTYRTRRKLNNLASVVAYLCSLAR